jgi:hypothetical protein
MSPFSYSFRIMTAQRSGPCCRCDRQVHPGDRIAWGGGAATHLECVMCRDCGKLSENVNGDRRCPKCADKAYRTTPEGQKEQRARRSEGASKAAETRRLNACKHDGATSCTVPYNGPPTQLKWDCPKCGRTRWTGLNGEDCGISEWRWL